jgi:hypothetical protein
MTRAEQRRMIQELRDYVHRMTRTEEEEFTLMLRRDKDDEDLDLIRQRRLTEMHTRLVVNRRRP